MTSSCYRAVAKMTHCPACSGLSLKDLKPCSNYCTNVMKGCLAYHSQLDTHWNEFIVEMEKVIDRLLGPFNIEMVVEPINIKISDAIMNFQENATPVSQSVFTACGRPPLGRRRRQALSLEASLIGKTRIRRDDEISSTTATSDGEISLETLDFGGSGKKGRKQFQPPGADGLEKVIKEAKLRLKDTKNFWKKLPYHMCGGSKTEEHESCWNGQKKDKYVTPVVGDGMNNQQNNPEVLVDVTRPNSLVNEQVYALKTITGKLKTAFMGRDVEWFDTDDTLDSGSGSGYGPDDEDSSDIGSGSSGFPTENEPEPPTSEKGHSTLSPPPPSHIPNEEDNRLYPIVDQSNHGQANVNTSIAEPSGAPSARVLNRAVLSYFMPIIVVYFGRSVNQWWH